MHFRLNYNTDNLSLVLSYYRIYWVLCDGGEAKPVLCEASRLQGKTTKIQ